MEIELNTSHRKIAHLTIDDSPSAKMQEKIDYLNAKGIPAIFFVRGEFVSYNRPALISALEHGFILGNHSFSHPPFSQRTLAQCIEEIEKTEFILEDLYKEARVERKWKLIRFPFGDKGGGRDWLTKESQLINRKVQEIQDYLRAKKFHKGVFNNITFSYFSRMNSFIDMPWTFDAYEYRTITAENWLTDEYPQINSTKATANQNQKKNVSNTPSTHQTVSTLDDVLSRMNTNDPENMLGLHTSSTEIVLLHDFATTSTMFIPIVEALLHKNLQFTLPDFTSC